jgi:hypothetical protein
LKQSNLIHWNYWNQCQKETISMILH